MLVTIMDSVLTPVHGNLLCFVSLYLPWRICFHARGIISSSGCTLHRINSANREKWQAQVAHIDQHAVQRSLIHDLSGEDSFAVLQIGYTNPSNHRPALAKQLTKLRPLAPHRNRLQICEQGPTSEDYQRAIREHYGRA